MIYNNARTPLASTLIENAGEGQDRVFSNLDWTLSAHFENLTLLNGQSDFDQDLDFYTRRGINAQPLRATGNAGDDILDGGQGNDALLGTVFYYCDLAA